MPEVQRKKVGNKHGSNIRRSQRKYARNIKRDKPAKAGKRKIYGRQNRW